MGKFKWCFIGTGTLAKQVAKEIIASGRHEIVSCYTRNPDRKSVKNCQKLVLEDVKHVNYTFIQYMKPKTEKKLQTLKDTLELQV